MLCCIMKLLRKTDNKAKELYNNQKQNQVVMPLDSGICIPGGEVVFKVAEETVEQLFGTAQEHHGFRYTQMIGKTKTELKILLAFVCMNLRKLAKLLSQRDENTSAFNDFIAFFAPSF